MLLFNSCILPVAVLEARLVLEYCNMPYYLPVLGGHIMWLSQFIYPFVLSRVYMCTLPVLSIIRSGTYCYRLHVMCWYCYTCVCWYCYTESSPHARARLLHAYFPAKVVLCCCGIAAPVLIWCIDTCISHATIAIHCAQSGQGSKAHWLLVHYLCLGGF